METGSNTSHSVWLKLSDKGFVSVFQRNFSAHFNRIKAGEGQFKPIAKPSSAAGGTKHRLDNTSTCPHMRL